MVRFLMFLTRTCIGDNGLSSLFDAICEPIDSQLNLVDLLKQEKVAIREEIMKLCKVGARRGPNRDQNC